MGLMLERRHVSRRRIAAVACVTMRLVQSALETGMLQPLAMLL